MSVNPSAAKPAEAQVSAAGEVSRPRQTSARWFEVGVVAGLLAFVAVTNRWISWAAGYRLLSAHDEADYRAIALAAPHLPKVRLQEQHAQRFPLHYLIGLIARAVGLKVETVYMVAAILLAIGLCALLGVVLTQIAVSRPVFGVCSAVFILNPYSLRYYGLAPGELGDLAFEAAILAAILGCLRQRFWLVLVGVGCATLARQSALPAAAIIALWVLVAPGWRQAGRSTRILRGAAVVLLAAGLYLALVQIAASFSAHTTPDFAHFTMLADLERLPAGVGQLGQHFVRSVNGLLSVGALAATALLVRKRLGSRAPLSFGFWGCTLIALSILAQPVVFSAEYAAHNETRLAVLALGALVCALAFALHDARWLTPKTALMLIGVLAVGSLHHIYTIIGTASATQTVALQVITAACLAVLLWTARAKSRSDIAQP